jgi:uncharacterized protein
MSKPVALITGASSGIGYAFAEVLAGHGYDLIVTARREAKLQQLADALDCQVTPIGVDLATARGAQSLFKQVTAKGLSVDVLVNNAGISQALPVIDTPRSKLINMVNLNIRALTELTSLFLPHMVERGSGHILNVASVAAFSAVPGMSVYSASKAFVLSFTESLSEELKQTGVTVSALCPGLTKTEMVDDLQAGQVPQFLMASASDVAREGYDAMMRKEVIHVPGPLNKSLVAWLEMQPRWLVRSMSGFAARMSFKQQ